MGTTRRGVAFTVRCLSRRLSRVHTKGTGPGVLSYIEIVCCNTPIPLAGITAMAIPSTEAVVVAP